MNFDKFGVAGRINEFDQRNGGDPVFYQDCFFYRNGAYRDSNPLGLLADPSTDEYTRLGNIVRYHQGRLAEAVREFDSLKEQLMFSACPDGRAIDQLKQLQTKVSKRNAAVEKAKLALAGTAEGQRREQSRQMDAEQRQKQAAFHEEVRSIRV